MAKNKSGVLHANAWNECWRGRKRLEKKVFESPRQERGNKDNKKVANNRVWAAGQPAGTNNWLGVGGGQKTAGFMKYVFKQAGGSTLAIWMERSLQLMVHPGSCNRLVTIPRLTKFV